MISVTPSTSGSAPSRRLRLHFRRTRCNRAALRVRAPAAYPRCTRAACEPFGIHAFCAPSGHSDASVRLRAHASRPTIRRDTRRTRVRRCATPTADFRYGSPRVPIARVSLNPSACSASAPGLFPTRVPSDPQTHVRERASRHVRCGRVSFRFRRTRCNRAALRDRVHAAYPRCARATCEPFGSHAFCVARGHRNASVQHRAHANRPAIRRDTRRTRV